LSFSYHIPDNNCQFSSCGSNGGVSAFSISDPFEKWGEGMLFLISYTVCSLAKSQGYGIFSFRGFTTYYPATAQLVIGYQAKPTGESFGRGKSFDVISHIAEQAKYCGMTYSGNLEKICLPDEVWDLYSWKNGVNPTAEDSIGNLSIFELAVFVSFQEAMDIQKSMAGSEYGWDKNKFPLFTSGGGDYYLIEGDISKNEYGSIYYYFPGAVDFERMISQYDSLYTLFLTIYESFSKNIFTYREGVLEVDDEKSFEIGKKLNPRSDYYKLYS